MRFFFVRDYRHKYRYFSSAPVNPIQIKTSRFKDLWELAKKKLTLLPQKSLKQEQAFGNILKFKQDKIQIFYSGIPDQKKMKTKFYFFLQRQRTKHILLLVGETLLLPISGLAILLPGPNVFFGVLALFMITHWQAFRGINKTLKKNFEFISSHLLSEWEQAQESKQEKHYAKIFEKIEKEFHLDNIQKVLWK
jgi:hypothetical protein